MYVWAGWGGWVGGVGWVVVVVCVCVRGGGGMWRDMKLARRWKSRNTEKEKGEWRC